MRFRSVLVMVSLLCLTACNVLPGWLVDAKSVLKGQISGSGMSKDTKLAVVFGLPDPSEFSQAEVIAVASDGSFSYPIPAGQENLTAFAFQDTNANSRVDAAEPNSFEVSKCRNCSYIQATLDRDVWKVLIREAGATLQVDIANAAIRFNG
ncbi:MAG: hypothetical protein HY692_03030 [Cyanobacteria bacterium NC_groundwater_1444_Ag_S-0.65um_54_12]|nr:hypothetical protein [Cyanobacteria bacterium NC_groundwater_1444_Ag_S-0.65um_54_12]